MSDPHLSRLPVVKAPDAIWNSIEASLRALQPEHRTLWRWAWLPATAVLLVVALWWFNRPHGARWEVVRKIESQPAKAETVGTGELLQTDAHSTVEMNIGSIGKVEIEPNTRLRVIATKQNDNRLSLEHGEIAATISAPPKLFFVETKSATAVDLGCEYRMKVDDAGNGLLRVTRGWVSFEWQGRESLVPAGANCRTRAGTGPGTPFFEDAPSALTAALEGFDFSGGSETALRAILAAARSRDTLTLWHLLARVPVPLRPLVYDRMVSFAPPPAGVTREKALALDPLTLKVWKDELAWTW
jgi:hypothetical protein